VSSLPVFEVLSNQLGMEVHVLCRPLTLPLIENNPFVEVAHSYQPELEAHLVKQLQLAQFDAMLVLVNDEIALRLSGKLKKIPVRIGPVSKPKAWMQYNYPALQKRSRSIKNEAEYNLDLLKIFGYDQPVGPKPALYFQPEEKATLTEKLSCRNSEFLSQGYVVLHPGMSGSALNWPVAEYQALLAWLVGQGLLVVMTGSGEAEQELVCGLREALDPKDREKTLDLVDQITLRELALLCKNSRLFIGPSTGPTHVAGAVDAPVISFYPPILVQSHTRWAPFQANSVIFTPEVDCPVERKCNGESCRDFGCMGTLSQIKVQQACLDKLRPNPLRS